MHTLMVVLNYLSVFIMLGCTVVVSTHKSSKMQKLILIECLTLLICCVGFLLRVETTTLEVMVASQKLIYGSVTHAMLTMLLFILEYCNFKTPKWLTWIFHGINLVITGLVLLDDRIHLLYKSTSLIDGVFVKEYGPLHTIAIVVFGLYMAASLIIAIIYSVKNIRKRSTYVWLMLIAVAIPCLSYILSKVLGDDTDIQPVGFAIFAILLLVMIYGNKLYDVKNIAEEYSIKSLENALIVFDGNYRYKGCNDMAMKYFPILKEITIDSDIRKESTILTNIYDENLKDYYFEDRVMKVSIRPITSGTKVVGKVIWMSDVTVERKYTELLESQVGFLSDISYKDQLTGLENRRSYEKQINVVKECEEETPVTVFTFDINGLKHTNDTYGHAVGDELIKESANIIQETFALLGNVYRVGGDEFIAIIIGDVDGNKLKEEFENKIKNYSGKYEHNLSVSCGFASSVTSNDFSFEKLVNSADMSMYKSKEMYYVESNIKRNR